MMVVLFFGFLLLIYRSLNFLSLHIGLELLRRVREYRKCCDLIFIYMFRRVYKLKEERDLFFGVEPNNLVAQPLFVLEK